MTLFDPLFVSMLATATTTLIGILVGSRLSKQHHRLLYIITAIAVSIFSFLFLTGIYNLAVFAMLPAAFTVSAVYAASSRS
ncbi:MAG TPA: hypothetical protein PKD05_03675 [Candidatus Melainabacteria bacterium]|nr:hypothetical protein [Candidatus Melainabacteria bacterium]